MILKYLLLCYDALRQAILDVHRSILFKAFSLQKKYHKILVVRKGTIGDHVVCQPIYLAIKNHFEGAMIDLLTSSAKHDYAPISALPEKVFFDKLINFEDHKKAELFALIKNNAYDLVIELPQDMDTLYTQTRNMLVYRLCNIKTGIGWSKGNSFLLKNFRFWNMPLPRELAKHRQNLIAQGFRLPVPEIYLQANTVELPALMEKEKWQDFIVLAPGAKVKSKIWPFYQQLTEQLIGTGYKVAIIGLKGDYMGFSKGAIDLCGQMSMEQTRYFLTQVKLLICNDSGPMHWAYAAETPLIALFGGRSYPYAWWPPKNDKFKVIFKPIKGEKVAYIGHDNMDFKSDKLLQNIKSKEVMDLIEILGKGKL